MNNSSLLSRFAYAARYAAAASTIGLMGTTLFAPGSAAAQPQPVINDESISATCTADGGLCSKNEDCCSGDCSFSMGQKYCFPK